MACVYIPHYDSVMISIHLEIWIVVRILVNEGSGYNILFSSFFEKMGLRQEIITTVGGVYVFDGNKSILVDYILLDVIVMGKSFAISFLLIDCKSPINVILRRNPLPHLGTNA